MTETDNSQKPRVAVDLVTKVGGAFKLTSLILKRMRELNMGDRPLVSIDTKDVFKIVAEEIRQDKISLVSEDEEEEAT